jgi:dGTPase
MIQTRQQWEEREERALAPYAMPSRRSRGRAHPEEEDPYRTMFQRDRDRITHSSAFRRLEYKTQVFVNQEGDYYRTRLTHTMEVAQIARTVARMLGLNEDLVEAVSLSHDLGHTPFGHSGEATMSALMRDHGGFNHNLHGLRIVDLIERRYPRFPGLNLSYEAREALARHAGGVPAPAGFDPGPVAPLLEAQVVDLADSIAYTHHDMDDALTAGIFGEKELREVPILDRAFAEVERREPGLGGKVRWYQAINLLLTAAIRDLVATTAARLEEHRVRSGEDVRALGRPIVGFSETMQRDQDDLGRFMLRSFYQHYRVIRMARKARRVLEELFREYVRNPEELPPHFQRWVEEVGLERGVCDYIAGMTDRQAQGEYRKLFDPMERV